MILIDSNMWCYYFDESCKEHKYVVKELEKIIKKEEIIINTVIIMELAHFLIKNLGPINGKKKLEVFLSFPMKIFDLNYDRVKESINMLCEHSHLGIGGRDATLLSTMKKAKTNKIFTHDDAFKEIDWLKVEDPIPKKL